MVGIQSPILKQCQNFASLVFWLEWLTVGTKHLLGQLYVQGSLPATFEFNVGPPHKMTHGV
jgi:hypothetical protein